MIVILKYGFYTVLMRKSLFSRDFLLQMEETQKTECRTDENARREGRDVKPKHGSVLLPSEMEMSYCGTKIQPLPFSLQHFYI